MCLGGPWRKGVLAHYPREGCPLAGGNSYSLPVFFSSSDSASSTYVIVPLLREQPHRCYSPQAAFVAQGQCQGWF